MAHELETRMIVKLIDVALGAGKKVVDTQHIVALFQQPVDKMGTDETGSSGHQDTLAVVIQSGQLGFFS